MEGPPFDCWIERLYNLVRKCSLFRPIRFGIGKFLLAVGACWLGNCFSALNYKCSLH